MAGPVYQGQIAQPGSSSRPVGPPPKAQKGAPRFLNRASGKMETRQQMKAYKAPANRASAIHRAVSSPQHQPSGPAHAGPAPQSWLEMNPGQLQQFAAKQVGQATNAELAPFKARQGEITNQEQTAGQRYGDFYKQTVDPNLGRIQGEAGQSAKTFGNMAAESALRASKAIETTGQNTAAGNAGYLDPQVKAALALQQANVAATGQSGEAGAQARGQNQANFMQSLREAASLQALEGQRSISSAYGKQRGELGAKEGQILAGKPGRVSELSTNLLQKQFTNRATEQGLGVKIQALGQKETASRRTAETSRRGQNMTSETATANRNAKAVEAQQDRLFKEAHPAGASSGGSKGSKPKAPSPAEGRKYMGNLSKAESVAQQQLGKQRYSHPRQEQVRHYLRGLGYSGDQVSAAMNLAVYGKLGPQDEHTAAAYGLDKQMRPQWFR